MADIREDQPESFKSVIESLHKCKAHYIKSSPTEKEMGSEAADEFDRMVHKRKIF